MKNISLKKILFVIGLIICFISVNLWIYITNHTGYKVVNGIPVSELLIVVSNEKYSIDYCRLLKKATTYDTNAIKQLVQLNFYDGASYDHSAVIVALIEFIGEEDFIHILETTNDEQKKRVVTTIKIGLEYGNNLKLRNQTFKETFPKIHDFLITED